MHKKMMDMMMGVRILRPPKHTISTFGTTTIRYVLLSQLPDQANQCRLREGQVTAQRPQILTPDIFQKRFEGFGEESANYKELMDQFYGESFRALEYTFKNEVDSTSIHQTSIKELQERTLKALTEQDAPRTALLQSPDNAWGFAVMKFIVDYSMRSFPANMKELDERGFFDPPSLQAENRNRQQIEALFRQAQTNPTLISSLGALLKETGLFREYEDRFFGLIRHP